MATPVSCNPLPAARAPNSHPRQAKFSHATHFYLGHTALSEAAGVSQIRAHRIRFREEIRETKSGASLCPAFNNVGFENINMRE